MSKRLSKIKIIIVVIIGTFVLGKAKITLAENNEYIQIPVQIKSKIEKLNEYVPQEIIDDYYGMQTSVKLEKKTTEKFEIAIANKNGKYIFVEAIDEYEKAIEKIKTINVKSDEQSILINESGHIIYSVNSIGRIVNLKGGNPEYTRNHVIKIYPNKTSTNHITYINSGYVDDVPIIESSEKRVKIEVSGVQGWIDIIDGEYTNIEIVPLNQVKNLSYYEKNTKNELIHYISSDIKTSNKGNKIIVGEAPAWMKEGIKYYSYDYNYFYTDITKLLNDRFKNSVSNSININDKFYNYYSYLSGRSKTLYSTEEVNRYLANNTPSNSILRNKGKDFIEAQNKYGVNAGVMLGIAMNESAKGTSNIALTKNNIFGLNAVDSDTGQADKFNSVKDCINDFAKNWMSKKYYNPDNWVYSGVNLGNKAVGVNVQYASDPFWGEKASRYYYEMDNYLGNKDIYNYNIAIYSNEDKVYSNGALLYNVLKTKNKSAQVGYPTIVVKTDTKYSILPDTQKAQDGTYDWSKLGEISKQSIDIINKGGWVFENGYYYYKDRQGNNVIGWLEIKNKWYYFDYLGRMQTGWKYIGESWYYLKESGEMTTGWEWQNGWYYLKDSGRMVTGWNEINGKWYYMNKSGMMQTGWQYVDNYWYYLKETGEMVTGWEWQSAWYYLKPTGQMVTEWSKIGGKWYYMNRSGAMQTGWQYIKDSWYYLKENGEMATGWEWQNAWYYLKPTGQMAKGWNKINGKWYYMYSSGAMATNTTIDGWEIGSDGVANKK
ncbi:MAG: glucosaminidase domain-containing protein [Clostridium sp.]